MQMQEISAVSATASKQGAERLKFELRLSFPERYADFISKDYVETWRQNLLNEIQGNVLRMLLDAGIGQL